MAEERRAPKRERRTWPAEEEARQLRVLVAAQPRWDACSQVLALLGLSGGHRQAEEGEGGREEAENSSRRACSAHTCASSRVGEGLLSTAAARTRSRRGTNDEVKAAIFGEETAEHERQKRSGYAAVAGLC